ncbi:hypothetical protein BG004_001450 [Podila humilis]|nr:hypothetical protein BG004_001450 [Podila humilis]
MDTRNASKPLSRVTEEIIIDDHQFQDYPRPITQQLATQHQKQQAQQPEDPNGNEPYDSDVDQGGWCASSKATLQEGQILKSGNLMKKGERIKIWKKKWFVLRTSKLAYYKDNKVDYPNPIIEYELLRIIDIRDVHRAAEVLVKHKSHVFVILTPRRTFTVQAKNQLEMLEWIDTINRAKMQLEFSSSSDLDSFSGSSLQVAEQPNPLSQPQLSETPQQATDEVQESHSGSKSTQLAHRISRPALVKLGSGIALTRRHPASDNTNIADGTATSTAPVDSSYPKRQSKLTGKKKKNLPTPLFLTPPPSKQLHETNEILNTPTASPRRYSNTFLAPQRIEDLHLMSQGAQTLQKLSAAPDSASRTLPSPPPSVIMTSPGKVADSTSDPQTTVVPQTSGTAPSSPGYFSGGEEVFWTSAGEQNLSSGEDEIQEEDETDPRFLEAGRVASEANAPGSGVVSSEELGSKVIRQGYLLKLGNKYKTWRKKWFVLRGDKLTYYKNTKEYQPHGIIPLSTVIDCLQTDPISKSKLYCLRIVTAKRSFLCSAPDEDTLLQWLDALHVECDHVAKERDLELCNNSTTDLVEAASLTPPAALSTTIFNSALTVPILGMPKHPLSRSRSKSGELIASSGMGAVNYTSSLSSSIPLTFSTGHPSLGRSASQLRKMTGPDSAVSQQQQHQPPLPSLETFQLSTSTGLSIPSRSLPPAGTTVTFSA